MATLLPAKYTWTDHYVDAFTEKGVNKAVSGVNLEDAEQKHGYSLDEIKTCLQAMWISGGGLNYDNQYPTLTSAQQVDVFS